MHFQIFRSTFLPILTFIWILFGCGMNTDVAQSPFIFISPVGVPQFLSILAVNEGITDTATKDTDFQSEPNNYKPEFLVRYYVTNAEPQFVGYNLYITTAAPSVAETLTSGNVYLENGVQPSFPHLASEASTSSSKLQTHRVLNQIPPPGVFPFIKCEIYTFTMRALLNSGIFSNPSTPVKMCSSSRPFLCPVGSSCNPAECNNSSCTTAVKQNCPVGTLCNPCTISGSEETGCICPTGVSPPGCNL
ncbi:LIC11073 family putative lipoprotein [Leptospira kirschneri]|uniref:LIC11073 family putative lipoprotein n=1 Tax=Leptospira kirschneri TaxID=29507 RepID=UPI0002784327|nr:hypothetical protein [Leptospira kirschneri]EJO68743.1 putative lipoprotein [Leptospira kirschneri serovar Grippotyphosa str. RM52]EKP05774.1 putative lipoprotein [Leptospira kirschneri str. 2008720114]EKQ82889.1 putative lipoprotein [Leptospira kirschneri serovar Grippotyphosa str. Moskva]EKR07429.1 putative lipoprotein [Leptospira kirschneri serovar Valbuzzi str. 200702274]EMK07398.1 putative lipoprotein [Leptospira kirschneri str. MMD1493]